MAVIGRGIADAFAVVFLLAGCGWQRAGPATLHRAMGGTPGGHLVFSVADADTGRLLPSRATISGLDGTPDPTLGPEWDAHGAGRLVVAASGQGDVTVPPGTYHLTISHGPEWSIADVRATVTGAAGGHVAVTLRHVIPMDDWTACDFHVHSAGSVDSRVTIADRVASLVAEGVEFAVPTEHNHVGDYGAAIAALPAVASRALGGAGLGWVPAIEVTTDMAGTPRGHFNVFPYRPDPLDPTGGAPPANQLPSEIFRAIRSNTPSAIIEVNHPRMGQLGYFNLAQLDPIRNVAGVPDVYDPHYDALEVFNGFYLGARGDVQQVMNDWFALLRGGWRYVGVANSDSHVIAYQQAGYPRTYVYTPGAGDRAPANEAVLSALRAGHAFGTSGPIVLAHIGDAMPGDTYRASPNETAELVFDVMAAPWISADRVDVYRDGERLETLSIPPSSEVHRFHRAMPVTVSEVPSFYVLVVTGDTPMDAVLPQSNARPLAFTNPIWVARR